MEPWQIIITVVGTGSGIAIPVVLAAMSRDRSMMAMISAVKADVSGAKNDMAAMLKAATDPVHERINRIRDEFVRRDDLDGHLLRWEKQFDDLKTEMRRNSEKLEERFEELIKILRDKRT